MAFEAKEEGNQLERRLADIEEGPELSASLATGEECHSHEMCWAAVQHMSSLAEMRSHRVLILADWDVG